MTEPNDNTSTRPISVAELLAKNGSIGSPAPGGRRRRRRGNADAVTVAELTGEIPIIRLDDPPAADEAPTAEATPVVEEPVLEEVVEEPAAEEPAVEEVAAEEPVVEEPVVEEVAVEDEPAEPEVEPDAAETDYEAHVQQRDVDVTRLDFTPRRRAHGLSRRTAPPPAGGAEEMTFDSLHDDEDAHGADSHGEGTDADGPVQTKPSYLRSPADALFGGDSLADDVARRGRTPGPEDIDLDGSQDGTQKLAIVFSELDAVEDADTAEAAESSPFMRGVWIVGQSILAVALGAGLFIAFDQLWKWNNIVALALSVLVILGLVVGVRVVRKTEDIASTLIAVAVGAMVTLGPLALLQST
ncbi:MAG: hypothetical protein ACSLFA_04830 [Mycobacterium sp.]